MGCVLKKRRTKLRFAIKRHQKPRVAAKLPNRLDMMHKNVHDHASGANSAVFDHTGAKGKRPEAPHFGALLRHLRDITAATQTHHACGLVKKVCDVIRNIKTNQVTFN
jgi:hypothetical protein